MDDETFRDFVAVRYTDLLRIAFLLAGDREVGRSTLVNGAGLVAVSLNQPEPWSASTTRQATNSHATR